ncbi:hypothetical protein ACOSQ3_023805 [Xanthoceras sorbifolium]
MQQRRRRPRPSMFLACPQWLNHNITGSNNNNMSPFLDYIVAAFFASLFGFLLLFVLCGNGDNITLNITLSINNTGNSSLTIQEAYVIQEESNTRTKASTTTPTITSTITATLSKNCSG